SAVEWHHRWLDTPQRIKQEGESKCDGANAGVAHIQLLGIGLCVTNKLLQVFCRKVLPCHDYGRLVENQTNRLEIDIWFVGKFGGRARLRRHEFLCGPSGWCSRQVLRALRGVSRSYHRLQPHSQ